MPGLTGLVKAASSVLPEVPKPQRKPSFNERLIWTAIAVVVYLVMAQVPLFGAAVGDNRQADFINIIFASSQGSLMSLGIGPIVTAGLILQLLKGADIIKLDFKKPEERALFTSATKLLTLIVTIVEGTAFTIGGTFGTNLSPTTVAIILAQLFVAGIVVMLLDELVQKLGMTFG